MILRHAGLGQLLAQLHHSMHDIALRVLQDRRHGLLGQVLDISAVLDDQPCQQLVAAVRVRQPGQGDRFIHQTLLVYLVALDRRLYQSAVNRHALVVHLLVQHPQAMLFVRHRELGQPVGDLALCDYVACAVVLEQTPLLPVMDRLVASPVHVCFGRFAGDAEVSD